MTISRMPALPNASIAASVVSVGASSSGVSASMRATSTATLPFPITTARSPERSNSRSWKSGWPLYQATNSVAAHEPGQVLARDAHPPVALRADGVDDGVVELEQLVVLDVAADLDVAEEAEARLERDLLEGARDRLDLRMVGRDAEAHEAPGRRQPLDHVDLDRDVGAEQRAGGVEAGRAGADDCDTKSAHRR